jgi:hypothetical protein
MQRISMNTFAKHYAMKSEDVKTTRINISTLIDKTAIALKERKLKCNPLPYGQREYKQVERHAPTIESVTRKTKFMNRSFASVETNYVPEPKPQPKEYKRTIFVTYVNGKTLVQA